METFIVILVMVLIAVPVVFYTIKHFKGESGCCGSGGYKPRKKRLAHVCFQKTFSVDGMHCAHCKARVEEVINDIDGISGSVDLKSGKLTVSYENEVSDDLLCERLTRVGYTLRRK